MIEAPRRWSQLAFLALPVLGVHLWLLSPAARHVVPPTPGTWRVSAVIPAALHPAPIADPLPRDPAPLELPRESIAKAPVAASDSPPSRVPARMRSPIEPSAAAPRTVQASPGPEASLSLHASPSSPAAAMNAPLSVNIPPPMTLHYRVDARARGIATQGEATLRFRHDGQAYEALLELSGPLLASRTQRSAGAITAEGLAPLRFADRARHEEATHFQREAGKVTFSSNRPDAALQPGAQDRLSVMLQLGAMLAAAPHRYPPGTGIALQTASAREADTWVFQVRETEALDLPGGRVEAVRLVRPPRHEYDLRIELWLAPGLDYAPVRVRLTQPNGDWVDQQWSSTDRG